MWVDRDSTKRFGISSNQIKKESLFRGEVKFLTGGNGWSNPHKSATRLNPAGRLGAIPKPTVKSGMKKRRVFLHVFPLEHRFQGDFYTLPPKATDLLDHKYSAFCRN